MLWLSVLVLAFTIYWWGWKLHRALAALVLILERVANRAAKNTGQPPVTDEKDWQAFL